MKINTALILCAGLGKRLNPLTLSTPKPLLKLKDVTMLESCIDINIKLGIKKILLNTFYLGHQISEFVKIKKFPIDIQIIEDGNEILDTGGGILNMIKHSQDNHFIVFNPDTLWHKNYVQEIQTMQKFYFSKKLNNILLSSHKKLSFDQNLKGDFKLTNNLLKKNTNNDFIYIGCQILDRVLFERYEERIFSVSEIWEELLKKNKLNGFESVSEFYHLTNLNIFNRLKDF
tara:strand:+ start:1733 stop:2422 length:690 start_codon:yes stop_codon:yes gene_type:complete